MTANAPENKYDAELPKPEILTEEESLAMRENLARRNFGMSLEQFTAAWQAGEFEGDRERHGKVISLAMLLPEYWAE